MTLSPSSASRDIISSQVQSDVFRWPGQAALFCALVGSGIQVTRAFGVYRITISCTVADALMNSSFLLPFCCPLLPPLAHCILAEVSDRSSAIAHF
jgi:hypothetical protein